MGDFGKWIVEDYRLTAANGRHIRMATRVRGYGIVVHFTEKMPREKAIKQVREMIGRGTYTPAKRFVD